MFCVMCVLFCDIQSNNYNLSVNRTRADLTDSIRDMENELTTLTADIKTAHQTNTSMIAMERTANVRLM